MHNAQCTMVNAQTTVITGRNADRLNETFDQLETTNKTQTLADMTNQDDVKSLVASLPPLDGAVLCAGNSITLPLAPSRHSRMTSR